MQFTCLITYWDAYRLFFNPSSKIIGESSIPPGKFMPWCADCHAEGRLLPMPPEAAKEIMKLIKYEALNLLQQKLPDQFGRDTAEEIASDRILLILERNQKGLLLPRDVHDKETFLSWMLSESWSRVCKVIESRIRGRKPVGSSILQNSNKDDESENSDPLAQVPI